MFEASREMMEDCKRKRLEDPIARPRTCLKLSEGFRTFMGGRKYCQEEELTRDVLLGYLYHSDHVKKVQLVKVDVHSMDGGEFSVTLDEDENQVVFYMWFT
jgi:hypothetical protein